MKLLALISLLTLLTPALSLPTSLTPTDLTWSIHTFTRSCSTNNICTYDFLILTPIGTYKCLLLDKADNEPVATHAFYDVPCIGNEDFHISWGWDHANDFTVMTVVHEPSQTEAFFGYNHPNESERLLDGGPNAVYSPGVH